jgi:hypothetical protein
VTRRAPEHLPESIRARLLNVARARGEEFQTLLTRYGIERLLYRLGHSSENDRFVLKGAVMFYVWEGGAHRPTRDVAFLGLGDSSPEALITAFRRVCATAVDPDGLTFDAETVRAAPIREENEYGGVRVTLTAMLSVARIPLQIDVGFGDAVTPRAETVTFPTLLDLPAPVVHAYPAESLIAEKYQAMVALGIANTRMKDFYDVYKLSDTHMFDGATLAMAIAATFARRHTPLPIEAPLAITRAFGSDVDKQTQWRAFLNRSRLTDAPESLLAVGDRLKSFLWRVTEATRDVETLELAWLPGVGWR